MATPIQTAQRIYAALDADDIDGFAALCSTDIEVIYPAEGALPYGGRWRGSEGAVRFLEAHDAAEQILEFEPQTMVAKHDTVFVLGHFRGRTRTTGREWFTEFVHVLTITDDRLARWQAFFDTAAAVAARTPMKDRPRAC